MQAINFKNSTFELNPNLILHMQLDIAVRVTSIENTGETISLVHDTNLSSKQIRLNEFLKIIDSATQKSKIVIIDDDSNIHATFGYYLRDNQIIIK